MWTLEIPAKAALLSTERVIVRAAGRWYARRSVTQGEVGHGVLEGTSELTAEGLWSEVARRLGEALNETTYQTWFADVRGLEVSDDTFTVSVPVSDTQLTLPTNREV